MGVSLQGEKMKKVIINVDRIDIRTRKSDDAIIIVLETGEYESDTVAELFKLPKNVVYKVTVELENES